MKRLILFLLFGTAIVLGIAAAPNVGNLPGDAKGVLKTLNGLTGNVTLSSEGGAAISSRGGDTITIAAGRAGGYTLGEDYNVGGPGQGRTIIADAGPVNITGPGGLTVGGPTSLETLAVSGTATTGGLSVTGTTRTGVLEITGGDLAEPFTISGSGAIPPGTVVVIDGKNPGELSISDTPYDRRVAGVVSGAGGINPGVILYRQSDSTAGEHVALAGRVYALADASNRAIQPGDLLTTSSIAGHVMTVTDYQRAQGAVIGKAMSTLESGEGLVLVLVSLQ